MPIEFKHKTLRTALELNLSLPAAQAKRILQLNSLDEMRKTSLNRTEIIQQQHKQWHDAHIRNKQFNKGEWALLYDSHFRGNPRKLQTRWLGPYEIQHVFDNGAVQLITIDPVQFKLLVNGHRLRIYNKPQTKDDFLQQFNLVSTSEVPTAEEGELLPVAKEN